MGDAVYNLSPAALIGDGLPRRVQIRFSRKPDSW